MDKPSILVMGEGDGNDAHAFAFNYNVLEIGKNGWHAPTKNHDDLYAIVTVESQDLFLPKEPDEIAPLDGVGNQCPSFGT